MTNPIQFVEKLQRGSDLGLPISQKVVWVFVKTNVADILIFFFSNGEKHCREKGKKNTGHDVLTLSQMTNFRLLQTEGVGRRHIQI